MPDLVRADINDRLLACMIGDAEPTPAEQERIERINEVWSMLTSGLTRQTIVKLVQKRHDISRSTGYELIKQATSLFGEINQSSREGRKAMYAENFRRLAKKAEEAGDYFYAGQLLDKAAKLEGAYAEEKVAVMNPADWTMPTTVFEISTDPQVFIESQVQDAEVIDEKADIPKH